jgi:hypothetical protein
VRPRWALFVFVLLTAPRVYANSRLPAANQLVVAPDDPKSMLLRTTFGYLFTADTGKTWDWLCEPAIPCAGQQDPAVALLNGGVVLSGQIEGLATSQDRGCSWSFVTGTANELIVDVARASDGVTAIALENVYAQTTDAGVLLYNSQILETTNAAKAWAPLPGLIDPTLVIDTVDIAPSDSSRIYVTGQVYEQNHATMLVSHDGGQSYLAYSIAFIANEYGAYIAAVDPNVADLVYVRTLAKDPMTGLNTSRLLVSIDGGQTFVQHWSGGMMLGFALSPDGSRVYLGSIEDGLVAANSTDLVFSQTSALQIQCLTTSGATLFACSNEASSDFILGSTTDEGASFTPLLRLDTIHQPLVCPPASSAAICLTQWPALEQELGIDGGGVGSDAGASATTSCGCESSTRPRDTLWVAAVAVLFILRSRLSRAAR